MHPLVDPSSAERQYSAASAALTSAQEALPSRRNRDLLSERIHLMQFRQSARPDRRTAAHRAGHLRCVRPAPAGDDALLEAPYARRRALLAELLVPQHPGGGPQHFTAEDIDWCQAPRLPLPPWSAQPRLDQATLIKTQEVLVGGWRPGEGNRSGRGSGLLLDAHDGQGRLHYSSDIGIGIGRTPTGPHKPRHTQLREQAARIWIEQQLPGAKFPEWWFAAAAVRLGFGCAVARQRLTESGNSVYGS